jgi:hypothetical protein
MRGSNPNDARSGVGTSYVAHLIALHIVAYPTKSGRAKITLEYYKDQVMNEFQKLGVYLAVILIIIRVAVRFFQNKDKPIVERLIHETAIDGLMIAATLGLVVSLSSTTLTLQSELKAVTKIVEDSPEYSLMQTIANTRQAIDNISEPSAKEIFTNFYNSVTDEYKASLSSIQNHGMVIPKEKAMLFGESAFIEAKKSVFTTSYVSPSNWWLTPDGNAYFLKNEDAIRRGIRITIIFIYSTESELKELNSIIEKQKKAGMTIYSILASKLPARMSRDIIIVDDRLVGELILEKDTRDFSKVIVNVDQKEVVRVQEEWTDLLRFANTN